jgi:hypothetical protein
MQTPLVKRRSSYLINNPLEVDSPETFDEPKKKVKTTLWIDIPEPFTEKIPQPMNSTSAAKGKSFGLFSNKPPQTCKVSTSTPTRPGSPFGRKFDFSRFYSEGDSKFDDFNREASYYNLCMRKCHRKTMEDRVAL